MLSSARMLRFRLPAFTLVLAAERPEPRFAVNFVSVRNLRPWVNRSPVKIKLPDGTLVDGRPRSEKQRKVLRDDYGKDPAFGSARGKLRHEEEVTRRERHLVDLIADVERAEDFMAVPSGGNGLQETPMQRLEYKVLTQKDNSFRRMIMDAKKKKNKKLNGGEDIDNKRSFVLEGVRLVRDALAAGLEPEAVFFARDSDLVSCFGQCPGFLADILRGRVFKTTYETMQLWSDLTTCPGIMGVFKMSSLDRVLAETGDAPGVKSLSVVFDNVRDPGNLGSMLRSAAAAGCREVLLTKGCVDAWDSKVVRGGMGAHLRIPVYDRLRWDEIRSRISRDAALFVADSEAADSASYRDVQYRIKPDCPPRPVVLVVGGETEGISGDAYRLMSEFPDCSRIHVPLARGVESLNVGAAFTVLVFHLAGLIPAKEVDA